jgi:hypothetical protein
MPDWSAASTFASAMPRVSWKWTARLAPGTASSKRPITSVTCEGTATPMVSPIETSAQPISARRRATATTRSGSTRPS